MSGDKPERRGAVAPLRKPVRCPVCRRASSRADYPFCSSRCADADLARWLDGGYAIPSAEAERPPEGED